MKPYPICYVCGRPIKSGEPLRLPGKLFRHPCKCQPGSAQYMKNRRLAHCYRALFAGIPKGSLR